MTKTEERIAEAARKGGWYVVKAPSWTPEEGEVSV